MENHVLCMRAFYLALLWVLISGCASTSPPVPRIQRRTPSAREIADHLQLWMDPDPARQIVQAMRPGTRPRDEGVEYGPPTEVRYATGEDEFLVLRFNNIRDSNGPVRNQLTDISITHFDDLKTAANAELFSYLKLIHRSPSAEGFQFNPLSLIRSVNGLWPLGKDKALQALRAYDQLCQSGDTHRQFRYDLDEQRIFLMARLLFVRSDHDPRMPVMGIGGTYLDDLRDNPHWPLFPLALEDDVPFFLVGGFNLGGVPESPTVHLDYCAAKCQLRLRPLAPTASPPLAAETLLNSKDWQALFIRPEQYGQFETRNIIRQQAVRAVEYLLPEPPTDLDQDPDAADRFWKQTVADLRRWPAEWNPADQRFH
jgi:hypothetical protein